MPQYEGKTGSTAFWAFLQGSGFMEYIKEQGCELPLPTHNFESLRDALEQRYQQQLATYRQDRKTNGFIETPATLAEHRLSWLRDTLKRNVEEWLNPASPTRQLLLKRRPSDRVELERYKRYLLAEIEAAEAIASDKPTNQPLATSGVRSFPKLLTDSYSESELKKLLIHLRMMNNNGQTIWPSKKKAGLFGVLDALVNKGKLIEASRAEYMASLSTYLDLGTTRVKDGYSAIQSKVRKEAISFLNQSVKTNK